jgi:hypothetical protein
MMYRQITAVTFGRQVSPPPIAADRRDSTRGRHHWGRYEGKTVALNHALTTYVVWCNERLRRALLRLLGDGPGNPRFSVSGTVLWVIPAHPASEFRA